MIGINPEKIEVNSQDEKFIKKALETVEAYIPESSFTVEDLSRELGMSRVSLYSVDKKTTSSLRNCQNL
jgi:AraC-like DNA-binding protein